jgi:alpha-1,2-mannosyltransferase
VDSIAYRRFQIVPINIVLYNVFSGKNHGPSLYGTEPWWYYVFNLLLYFNVMLPMAWCSLPLLVLQIRSLAADVFDRFSRISFKERRDSRP